MNVSHDREALATFFQTAYAAVNAAGEHSFSQKNFQTAYAAVNISKATFMRGMNCQTAYAAVN